MTKATCRCGQPLSLSGGGSDRVVCPKCGARVKIRRPGSTAPADGYIRFFCACGRRLKVAAANPPPSGQCPDCGKVVPVPTSTQNTGPVGHPETPTEELAADDLAALDQWTRRHVARAAAAEDAPQSTAVVTQPLPVLVEPERTPAAPQRTPVQRERAPAEPERAEVGLRVCPTCGKPVHLGSEVCRGCGTPVPRR